MHVLLQAALREVAHDPLRARVPAATLLAVCDEVQEAARLLWLGDPDRPLKPFEYVLARARVTVRVRVRVRVRVTLTRTLTLPLNPVSIPNPRYHRLVERSDDSVAAMVMASLE